MGGRVCIKTREDKHIKIQNTCTQDDDTSCHNHEIDLEGRWGGGGGGEGNGRYMHSHKYAVRFGLTQI